ncbi:MAG: hypothetical protein AB1567_07395 [bacterium]
MSNNQVVLDPKLVPLPNQLQEEENKIDPTFRNILRAGFLREAMGRKRGDVGWEDTIKIANLGYKHFDKNLDYNITIDDLKLYAPNISTQLTTIEQEVKEADFNLTLSHLLF